MNKIKIIERINWENRSYIKIKATNGSMLIIKKIVENFGDDSFEDDQKFPQSISKYKKWKDQFIPIVTQKIKFDIICGDKFIHLIFYKFPNFEFVNKVLDKYCNWEKPKPNKRIKNFIKKLK